ncbi:hypothetical protein C8R43DRAFT_1025883 [Mycena crocata]|nr:hypothetical protein C8R43DRAFT_1025883 [Mycena crocata]
MGLPARTTLIIAAAAGSVGGILLLLLLLYRLLRRPEKPAPLPPKQELARYREQQLPRPDSRPPTWYDTGSGFLSAPPSLTYAGSKSSLLAPDSRGGSPFRRPSFNTSESPSEDISHLPPMAPAMQLPQLAFDSSSTSLETAETDSSQTSPPPDSSFSHNKHQSRSPSASSRPQRRPRPLSVGSSGSAALSRNSHNSHNNSPRNTIRGMPHAPHSQVQIILPAPLAFNDRISIHDSPSRMSVVDQWAPPAVRSASAPVSTPIPGSQRRSSAEPRRSTSQSSLAQPPINAPQHPRRAASASAPVSAPAPQRAHPPSPQRSPHPPSAHARYSDLSTPPVPQIPQQWLPPVGDPLMGIPETQQHSGRGRSRDVGAPAAYGGSSHSLARGASDFNLPEGPPQPVDRPPPPPSKLQKPQQQRSRSRGR